MPPQPKSGAVIFARDPARVAAFYETLLGVRRTHVDDSVIVLESPMQQLVIHTVPAAIAQRIMIASPPKRRGDTAVKLVLPVASIAAARAQAPALGGELDVERKEFTARGFRACDGNDPEGNVIQFREALP